MTELTAVKIVVNHMMSNVFLALAIASAVIVLVQVIKYRTYHRNKR